MAAADTAQTTGAGREDAELRRRNVSGYEKPNGNQVVRLEAEDTKKLQKVSTPLTIQITTNTPQKQSSLLQILDDWEFIIAPIIFTAFALFTRLWKIGLSPIVTWDEAQ
jgi:dolichyl-phosphate-mannose-protein mannosyltransferase